MIVEISSEGLLPPKWFRRDKKKDENWVKKASGRAAGAQV